MPSSFDKSRVVKQLIQVLNEGVEVTISSKGIRVGSEGIQDEANNNNVYNSSKEAVTADVDNDSVRTSQLNKADLETAASGEVLTAQGNGDVSMQEVSAGSKDKTLYDISLQEKISGGSYGGIYPGSVAYPENKTGEISGKGTDIETFAHEGGDAFGICLDPFDGTVWVTDPNDTMIYHYNRDGGLIEEVTSEANGITGIQHDPFDGTFWEVDDAQDEVHHLDQEHNLIDTLTLGFTPQDIDVDPADGSLWTHDSTTDSLVNFDRSGSTIKTISLSDNPNGIAIDPADGMIWWVNGWVEAIKCDRDGNRLEVFDLSTDTFSTPSGVSVDPIDGSLWVGGNTYEIVSHVNRYSSASLLEIEGNTYTLQNRPSNPEPPRLETLITGSHIHQNRGSPTTSELDSGDRMTYVSDGSDGNTVGDLVSARNDSGTIVSQVIAPASNDTA